jgi:hypothetical protein
MGTWYALLDGSRDDASHIRRLFAASQFEFDEIDEKFALGAPAFEACSDHNQVIDLALELVASINVALRLSTSQYTGFQFHGLIERRDGKTNRFMLATGVSYGMSGAAAVAIAGFIGKPVRTREERLVSLFAKQAEFQDIANSLAVRPVTWAAMRKTYESVLGLTSSKADPQKRRADYKALIIRGWITEAESKLFHDTATYHSHGYPRTPIPAEMPHWEASNLVQRQFWRLVDEKEPT